MGVYINMEMPKTHPLTVTIYPDGQVLSETVGAKDIHGKAVPVPPHGRLIDADALVDSFDPSDFWNPDAEDNCYAAIHVVNCAPTVLEAEEVYGQCTDTAGNYHWCGTHSGEHKIKTEEGE